MEKLPPSFEISRVRMEFETNIRTAEANYRLQLEAMAKVFERAALDDYNMLSHEARMYRAQWETWCRAWLIVTGEKWHGPSLDSPPP